MMKLANMQIGKSYSLFFVIVVLLMYKVSLVHVLIHTSSFCIVRPGCLGVKLSFPAWP